MQPALSWPLHLHSQRRHPGTLQQLLALDQSLHSRPLSCPELQSRLQPCRVLPRLQALATPQSSQAPKEHSPSMTLQPWLGRARGLTAWPSPSRTDETALEMMLLSQLTWSPPSPLPASPRPLSRLSHSMQQILSRGHSCCLPPGPLLRTSRLIARPHLSHKMSSEC